MWNISYALFCILTIFSCKEKTNCLNANLGNSIIVQGFGKLSKKQISFYKFNRKANTFTSMILKDVQYEKSKEPYGFNENIIVLEKPLFSEDNYRLEVDNGRYNISDIKIKAEVRMMGMREDNVCVVNTFKINNKKAKQIYYTSSLTFYKPE